MRQTCGMSRKLLAAAAALCALAVSATSQAALPRGARAPQFATQGAIAGKVFTFNLRAALRRGPVVLYFYPKAFTQGCTLEARAFAEAHDQFAAAGATRDRHVERRPADAAALFDRGMPRQVRGRSRHAGDHRGL